MLIKKHTLILLALHVTFHENSENFLYKIYQVLAQITLHRITYIVTFSTYIDAFSSNVANTKNTVCSIFGWATIKKWIILQHYRYVRVIECSVADPEPGPQVFGWPKVEIICFWKSSQFRLSTVLLIFLLSPTFSLSGALSRSTTLPRKALTMRTCSPEH